MKAIKNNRPLIVGIFIFLGLVILVITVFTLGSQKKTFVKSFTLNAIFNDVGGLLKGANIWLAGVKVGTVKQISFYEHSRVQVTMSIEKDVQSYIHKGSMAKIGSDGLIGNKIIILYGGDELKPPVENEDFVNVEHALSTDDMLTTLQANNKNLLDITNNFKRISQKVDSGNGMIAALINDPEMVGKLKTSISDLQGTVANFRSASVDSRKVLANLHDFSGNLNKPGNAIHDLVTDTVIYRSVKQTLAELNQAALSAKDFAANLKLVSDKLSQKNNMVGVLINDQESAAALKNTLKNLESGSIKLDEDLEALQHNFLLKGFFKKKEKAKNK